MSNTSDAVARHRRMAFLAPSRALVCGWAVYFALFFVAPVRVVVPVASGPMLYLLVSCVMFLAGCWTHRIWRPKPETDLTRGGLQLQSLFTIVTTAAVIGIGLRIYDRFFLRGASLAEDVLLRRESLENAGSNIFSMFAAGLFPFCFVVLFVFFLRPRDGKRHPFRLLFSLCVFALPGLNAILVGSRSIILTSVLLMSVYAFYFGMLRINGRSVSTIILTSILLLFLFTSVFLDRLQAMGLAPESSVYNSDYAASLKPNGWIAQKIDNPGSLLASNTYFTYLNLTQYAVHGVFEFSYLYQNFTGAHTWGADTFSMYYKLGAFIFGLPGFEDRVLAAEPNSGVFTTFFGPLFIDFGWFGPLLVFGFGLVAQALWTQVRRGDVGLAPFYFYLVIVIFLSPIVNLLSNGEGLFILTSFALFWLGTRRNRGHNQLA